MRNLFKVFGLERSGVVQLKMLIDINGGSCLDHIHGWTFGAYAPNQEFNDQSVRFLYVVRNPHDWLYDCYLYHKANKKKNNETDPHFKDGMSFKEFVHSKHYGYETPVHRWNVMYKHWREAFSDNYIRFEDACNDQLETLNKINYMHDSVLLPKVTNLTNIKSRKIDNVINTYYDPETVDFVNRILDPELLVHFGYAKPLCHIAEAKNLEIAFASDLEKQKEEFEVRSKLTYEYPAAEKEDIRGIVICGGGKRYFTNAWVCIKMLRHKGCTLPIELWHLGSKEMTPDMKSLADDLGVTTRDALEVAELHPVRNLSGWPLKPYAILHSRFRHVMLLDADNVVVKDPTFLFNTDHYNRTGAIFWPDYHRLSPKRAIWHVCGVEYRDEPEFETGQIVVDTQKCWDALQLTMYMNEENAFFYKHVHGDKETFHMAWRKLNLEYAMPNRGIHALPAVMCQHDFDGERLFQHRNLAKWSLSEHRHIPDFWGEEQCYTFLEELRTKWKEQLILQITDATKPVYEALTKQKYFQYIREGHDVRAMEFKDDFTIGEGSARLERGWKVVEKDGELYVDIIGDEGVICSLQQKDPLTYKGQWVKYEKMPITLLAIKY